MCSARRWRLSGRNPARRWGPIPVDPDGVSAGVTTQRARQRPARAGGAAFAGDGRGTVRRPFSRSARGVFSAPGQPPPSLRKRPLRRSPHNICYWLILTERRPPVPGDAHRSSIGARKHPRFFSKKGLDSEHGCFSRHTVGRLPHCRLRGLPGVHSRSGPHGRRPPMRSFWSGCPTPCCCLHDPPGLPSTEATIVGRGSHPPGKRAFLRRTYAIGWS